MHRTAHGLAATGFALAALMLAAAPGTALAQSATPPAAAHQPAAPPAATAPAAMPPAATAPAAPGSMSAMPGMAAPASPKPAPPAGAPSTAGSSTAAYEAAMRKMHANMAIHYTGNADRDFVAGMIPHHQGAIDMAEVELQYGHDPALRKLAHEIIKTQRQEIAQMRRWQAKHGQKHAVPE